LTGGARRALNAGMKLSFLAAGGYQGAAGGGAWPVPPQNCDPEVAARSLAMSLALARRADELGFDWVSVSEHHYAPLMLTPNPLVWAGALTQVVKRAKIALLGPVLTINNPVRIAEETAMLDVLSGGRVVALFLRGVPYEWKVYSSEPADTKGATQDGIDLILKAWTAPEPFAWESPHHHFDVVSVWPRPLQRPHPPVFGSGNSEDSVLFAARRRLGLAISFAPPEQVAKHVALYRAEAEKAGWTPGPDQVLYRAVAQIAETDAEADAQMARTGGGRFVPYFNGGPGRVLGQIEALHEAGVGVIDMAFGPMGQERALAALEMLSRDVLPAMRAAA
jgi:alkanesulfonate monooxygenase SsuD/methylene tetrahydromethanopterin reductase-like flavin-dependent oxidoreductase (luciferase family)